MHGITPFKIFMLFGIVSAWAEKALKDGNITLTEAAGLAEDLGPVLGIPVQIEVDLKRRVTALEAEPPEEEAAAAETVEERPPPDTPPER